MMDESSAAEVTPPTHKSRKLPILVAAIVVLALIGAVAVHNTQGSPETKPTSYSSSGAKVFNMHLDDGKLTSGPRTITVGKGDKVQIAITTSNQNEGDVHIDGYNLNTAIESNSASGFEFTADKTGSFNIQVRQEEDDTTKQNGQVTDGIGPWQPLGTLIVK